MPGPRSGASFTGIGGSLLLLLGGKNNEYLDDSWILDLTSFQWTPASGLTLPTKRAWHGVGLADDLLYLYGGKEEVVSNFNDLWTINTSNIRLMSINASIDNWSPVYVEFNKQLLTLYQRSKFGFVITQNKVFLFGGRDWPDDIGKPHEQSCNIP